MPLTPKEQRPARITLKVTLDAQTQRAAAQLARQYSGRKLETVLAAFVGDLAADAGRPDSAALGRATAWLGGHEWVNEPRDEAPRLRQDEVMGSAYGAYPWDGWEKRALARGVAAGLATLGRELIREAWQHDWNEELKARCGWADDGRRLLRQALRSPARAQACWQHLLDTDGGRFQPNMGKASPCR